MATNLERLPRSLANNKYAQSIAKKLDAKTAQNTALKQTAGRPSRGKRGLSAGVGAILVGGAAGLVESNVAKAATGIVGGGAMAAAGAAMDSDAVFDAGMGAVCGGLFVAAGSGVGMAKTRVLGSDDDELDDDDDELDDE